jgi:hypothetical protein
MTNRLDDLIATPWEASQARRLIIGLDSPNR